MTFILVVSLPTRAQGNGALYITDITGTAAFGNVYTSKSAVHIRESTMYISELSPSLDVQGATLSSGPFPDGTYVFQVTDPSGSVLLSLDDITCRQVVVSGGAVIGVPSTPAVNCVDGYHNLANGGPPIQLCNPNASKCATDFADTPDPGGWYKTWLTPVAHYTLSSFGNTCSSPDSHVTFGFCDSDSKTDYFKIKKPGQADVTVCKFLDPNGNGFDDAGESLIFGSPITATGVDGDTGSGVLHYTGQDACTTFTVSKPIFDTTNPATVTLSEDTSSVFRQTAPDNGTCIEGPQFLNGNPNVPIINPNTGNNYLPPFQALTGTFSASDTCMVSGASANYPAPASGGVITLTLSPGDTVRAPFFANQTTSPTLLVSQTANGGDNFKWTVAKSAGQTQLDTTTGSATFTYKVNVTHDGGTGWQIQGNITVMNPNFLTQGIDSVTITDTIDHGGACNVNGTGTNTYGPVTIGVLATLTVPYTCTFASNPVRGTNTIGVTWDPALGGGGPVSVPQPYDFTSADTTVVVTDSLAGNLGTVTINNDNTTSCAIASIGFNGVSGSLGCLAPSGSTASFTYSLTFTGDPAGTCTEHDNTASFQTNTGAMASSRPATAVFQCVGATKAPAITSRNYVAFTIGVPASFTVTATGFPTPKLTESGSLPAGLTFVDNGNGTATLGGTPAASTAGFYLLNFTASNGVGSNATQTFTLIVLPDVTTTTLVSSANPSQTGQAVTFTATVKSKGAFAPTGTVTFRFLLKTLATVPLSNGTASYITTALPTGKDVITATYNGDSNNLPSLSNVVTQTEN